MVKDTKMEELRRSVDEQIVTGSSRDFALDSFPEDTPPSESGDFDPRLGRQRQHRPMGAQVSPGVALVPYRSASIKIDPRALNLRGSGAVCG